MTLHTLMAGAAIYWTTLECYEALQNSVGSVWVAFLIMLIVREHLYASHELQFTWINGEIIL